MATLREAIQSATNSAFLELDSILTDIAYKRRTLLGYDTVLGLPTYTLIAEIPMRVLIKSVTQREVEREPMGGKGDYLLPSDKTILINPINFTFDPSFEDLITDADGDWEIKRIKIVPADALVSLKVRRPGA